MNVNATLFVQLVVLFILSWVTMKFIWPPLMKVLDERVRVVTEGIALSQRAQEEWAAAQEEARQTVRAARARAAEVCHVAQQQATTIVDQAHTEATKMIVAARFRAEKEAELVLERARAQLRTQLSQLVILGTQRILQQEVDAQKHADILQSLTDAL